jgi:thiamine biosynthesis lipoprotein
MNRRSFLKLPALVPLTAVDSALRSEEHHFQYEGVLGTSMDLVVWTPHAREAEGACRTVLEEIDRLDSILNTRIAHSEISLLENSTGSRIFSRELREVLDAYDYWEVRTGGVLSIRPDGANTARNVDALGKAYIIDDAAMAAHKAYPSIDAFLLNIGGDISVWGRSCNIALADPRHSYDNAEPMATIRLHDAAVATSGTYARGNHLKDARSGKSPAAAVAATVVANDAVTANALATLLCVTGAAYGFPIVEATPGAEALRVERGVVERTSGFVLQERPATAQTPAAAWPASNQLTITLPLKPGRSSKRPYVAVWVEDSSGKLVNMLALWGTKSKYYPDLSTIWGLVHGIFSPFRSVTRATRPAGQYQLVWKGLDNDGKPVPPGSYRITVETNQEHGTYAKESGTIVIGNGPASITLPATANFDQVLVQYGPR